MEVNRAKLSYVLPFCFACVAQSDGALPVCGDY